MLKTGLLLALLVLISGCSDSSSSGSKTEIAPGGCNQVIVDASNDLNKKSAFIGRGGNNYTEEEVADFKKSCETFKNLIGNNSCTVIDSETKKIISISYADVKYMCESKFEKIPELTKSTKPEEPKVKPNPGGNNGGSSGGSSENERVSSCGYIVENKIDSLLIKKDLFDKDPSLKNLSQLKGACDTYFNEMQLSSVKKCSYKSPRHGRQIIAEKLSFQNTCAVAESKMFIYQESKMSENPERLDQAHTNLFGYKDLMVDVTYAGFLHTVFENLHYKYYVQGKVYAQDEALDMVRRNSKITACEIVDSKNIKGNFSKKLLLESSTQETQPVDAEFRTSNLTFKDYPQDMIARVRCHSLKTISIEEINQALSGVFLIRPPEKNEELQ